MKIRSTLLLATVMAMIPQAGVLSAQTTGAAPSLSGLWELRFDSRNVPQASVIPGSMNLSDQAAHDTHAIRYCYNLGIPFLMNVSPIDIVQNLSGKETVLTFPYRGPSRHIYTDGRAHVNADIFDPSSSGDSVGHWEGDTLVVDTVGFSEEGVTPTSHLMERYRLVSGGKQLSVTFTWEDPKVFANPHTYEFRYYRAPKGMEAREYDCNASNEERAKFLLGTPGKEFSRSER